MKLLRQLLRGLVGLALALLLLFEEWGWEPLAAAMAWLARLPLLRELERCIRGLPPKAAMAVFALPTLALLPIKLFAVYLFGAGHATLGLLLLLAAKVAGTALVARLFQLTQPALMQLGWFARIYGRWKRWKDELLRQVRLSPVWLAGQRLKASLRERLARWQGPH